MSNKFFHISDFNIGDEVWWFKIGAQAGCINNFSLKPGDLELVHDTVKEIKNDYLECWHCRKRPKDIWGKTRK